MSRIDAYLDALDQALRTVGETAPWPFHIAEVAPYFDDIEALDLHARLRQFTSEGLLDVDLAALFPSANSVKTLLMDLICGMKVGHVPRNERVWLVERMFDVMTAMETGDIFCRDGSHRIITNEHAQRICEDVTWTTMNDAHGRSFARAAHQVSAAGQALVWALYFYAWTDMGWEIHGPYEVRLPTGSAALMLIKDYFDLSPRQLWPEAEHHAVRSMRLMTLHPPITGIRFDVLNHVLHDRPLAESSLAVHLSVDDQVAAQEDDLVSARNLLLTAVREQQRLVKAMDRTELLDRFVDSRYYAFRRWRSRSGDDWRPPSEVRRRIRAWPTDRTDLPEVDDLAILRQAFDPRMDFVN